MFSGQTLFILGAGASADAELPVGWKLKEQIAGYLKLSMHRQWVGEVVGDDHIAKALKHICREEKSPERLLRYVQAGGRISEAMLLAKSIDHFLHSNRGDEAVETCGKLAIARAILHAERKSLLFVDAASNERLDLSKVDGKWYLPFAELLCSCTLNELEDRLSRIQFIVFNYDRCLEHFLLWAFRIYFNLDESTAAAFVNRIRIWHPYGQVGKLHWQARDGYPVAFGDNERDLSIVAKQVKTFTESTDESDSDIIAIRSAVEDADTTILLGCAYHKLNLNLITPKGSVRVYGPAKRFYGTTKGLSDPNRGIASSRVLGLAAGTPRIDPIMPSDMDCTRLFRDYYYALDE